MKRFLVGIAAIAACATALPAHAAEAAAIEMQFDVNGTCAADGRCSATLTARTCLERAYGPRCSADPVTIPLVRVGSTNLACPGLRPEILSPDMGGWPSLVVHTTAFGDIDVRVNMSDLPLETLVGFGAAPGVQAHLAGYGDWSSDEFFSPCPAAFTGGVAAVLVVEGL